MRRDAWRAEPETRRADLRSGRAGANLRRARVVLVLLVVTGCANPSASGPAAWRAPGFRPSTVKRPAVFLQVSIDRVGLGSGPFTERERASIPEQYEAALQDALNDLGILPVDLTLEARRTFASHDRPLEQVDVRRALGRAREAGAEHLLVLDARLSRRELTHCRDSRRPLSGSTTFWEAGMELIRVSDATRLVTEPPGEDQRVVDVELDCQRGRLITRRGMEEMIEESVKKILAPLSRP